jgi:hypothetical protein
MWPIPEEINLEVLFAVWKDTVEVTKALDELFISDIEDELLDTYDRLLVEGHHEEAEAFWQEWALDTVKR